MRRLKDPGFYYRDDGSILNGIKQKLQRWFICWIFGHDLIGVYSWIGYCQRCYQTYEPEEEEEIIAVCPACGDRTVGTKPCRCDD